MRKMIVVALCLLFTFFGLISTSGRAHAEDRPPPVGGVLPDIALPIPDKPEERHYLGVDGKGTFKPSKIRAEVVIIEVFSMYCPYCQKEAPSVNELYRMIDQDKEYRGKIKLIGIGAGNSPFEVDTFRNAYSVPFPLFPDMDFSLHNALGKVRTPCFIAIKINKDGSHKIVYSKVGSFGDPSSFLQLVAKPAGMKKGK
jgi:thiol-disulfide isomerase/thioredoxin